MWDSHKTGYFTVHRRTIGKRMAAKLKDIGLRCHADARTCAGNRAGARASGEGYFQYHAIPGNGARMRAFRKDVLRIWYQALRRRSQGSRLTRERFLKRLAVLLPPVQVLQPYPSARFDAKHPNIRGKNVCVSSASTGPCGGQRVNRCPYRDRRAGNPPVAQRATAYPLEWS